MSLEHTRALVARMFPVCPICNSKADYWIDPYETVAECKICKTRIAQCFYLGVRYDYWSTPLEIWKRVLDEMRLIESKIFHHRIWGRYRNHEVVIDEIVGYREENEPVMYTRFLVEFDNSLSILMSIKRVPSYYYPSLLDQCVGDIHLGNVEFLKGLIIKGSNEDELNIILDSHICNSIMKMKKNLSAIEVGRGSFKAFEGPRTLIDIEPDLAVYVDRRSFPMKRNVVEFRFALDTLIDLVEKMERNVPYIREARRREEESKEARRRDEAQILLELPATTLRLLENSRRGEAGLTAKEIGDELRGTGLAVQNIDVIRALSKLTDDGEVTKVLGSDREIRYSRKEKERPR